MKVGGYQLHPVQIGGELKGTVGGRSDPLLYTQEGTALSTINNTGSLTAFAAPFTPPTVAAGALSSKGAQLFFQAWGSFATTGTPTLVFTSKFDSISTGAQFGNAAFTCPNNSLNYGWTLSFGMVVMTTGSSGTFGTMAGEAVLGNTPGSAGVAVAGFPFTGVTLDMTAAHTVQLGVTWGAADPANTITLQGVALSVAYPVTAG